LIFNRALQFEQASVIAIDILLEPNATMLKHAGAATASHLKRLKALPQTRPIAAAAKSPPGQDARQ